MDYDNTLVICMDARSGDGFTNSLRAGGFQKLLIKQADENMRETFNRALAEGPATIITVREDDGFTADDIKKIADALAGDNSVLYVGARQNSAPKNLPANIFGFLSGISANDVQSSLLGMSAELCRMLVRMKSSDVNFFFNIPLEARANDVIVKEIPTGCQTDFQPGFRILSRSFKLYFVFIKFSISAFIAYLVDIGSFYLFELAFVAMANEYKILTATVLSRVLCSIATYFLNKGAVFKSHAKGSGVVIRFIILSAGQLILSWLLVWGVGSLLGGGALTNMAVKVVADLIIFIASFSIQRDWVFKKTAGVLK